MVRRAFSVCQLITLLAWGNDYIFSYKSLIVNYQTHREDIHISRCMTEIPSSLPKLWEQKICPNEKLSYDTFLKQYEDHLIMSFLNHETKLQASTYVLNQQARQNTSLDIKPTYLSVVSEKNCMIVSAYQRY